MKTVEGKSKTGKVFIRIVITLVGVALIFLAARDVGLTVIGKTATATVTTKQYNDSPDFNEPIELQYKWKVSWTFTADGKEYSGSDNVKGSATNVIHGNTVYYYPFAPQINSLYAKDAAGVGTVVLAVLGLLLIIIANRKTKKAKVPEVQSAQKDVDKNINERVKNMAKFCSECGAELQENAKFCPSCGSPARGTPSEGDAVANSFNADVKLGFSDRINSPEVIEYVRKSNKSARGCAFVLIPLPFVIYMIVSFVSDEVKTADALIFGGGMSAVFLLIYLLSKFISNAKRSWDGVVTDKQSLKKTKHINDRTNERWELVHYTDYILTFHTDNGKKERCVERIENSRGDLDYYPYLNVGDRVRYYPQLPYKYEKYDKSRDSEIPCMFCKTFNDIHNDKCVSCGKQLFK